MIETHDPSMWCDSQRAKKEISGREVENFPYRNNVIGKTRFFFEKEKLNFKWSKRKQKKTILRQKRSKGTSKADRDVVECIFWGHLFSESTEGWSKGLECQGARE